MRIVDLIFSFSRTLARGENRAARAVSRVTSRMESGPERVRASRPMHRAESSKRPIPMGRRPIRRVSRADSGPQSPAREARAAPVYLIKCKRQRLFVMSSCKERKTGV
jgi:hypothetical protein